MEKRFKDKYRALIKEEIVREVLLRYFPCINNFKFTCVDQGYENINLIIRVGYKKYVLRIYNDKIFKRLSRTKRHLLYELNFTNYLSAHGIPVAHLRKTLDNQMFTETILGDKKLFVILMDFVKGKQVRVYNKEKIENFAMWMAKIHELSLNYESGYIRESDGALNFYKWKKHLGQEGQRVQNGYINNSYLSIMNDVHQFINPEMIREFTPVQIHADMHPGNIRFIGNKLSGIFDYDDTRHSIIPEDIGVFFDVLLRRGSKKALLTKVGTFFTSYESIHKISKNEKVMSFYYALEKIYQFNYFAAYHEEKKGKLNKERVRYYLKLAKRFDLIKSVIKEYEY